MAERLDVLAIEEGKEGKSYFYRVGVAFPAKDGEGWNVTLAALPVNGRLLLRPPREKRGNESGF